MVGNWALGQGPWALAHGPWAPTHGPFRRPTVVRGAQAHGPRAQIYVPGGHDVFVFQEDTMYLYFQEDPMYLYFQN